MSISLTGFGPSVTFAENTVNAAPQVIDGDVTLIYVGPVVPTALSISGLLAQDRVSIANQGIGAGQIGFNGSVVTFGGAQLGTAAGGVGGTLTVAFTGAPSAAALDALVQALTYANVSNAPAPARSLTLAIQPLFGAATTQTLTVNVTPQNDAPLIVSGTSASFVENGTGIAYQAAATDPDGTTSFTWSLSGPDEALFTIDAAGAVRFKAAPDFEAPQDALADNVHKLTVTVSDGVASASRAVDIVVTDVDEPPTLTGLDTAVTFAESAVNAGPRFLDADVVFRQGEDLAGAQFSVSGLLAEDRVALADIGNGPGEIGFDGTTVRFGGTVVGTAAGGVGETFAIKFNAAVTASAVDAVIEALTYANTSDTPAARRRLVLDLVDESGIALDAPVSMPGFAQLLGAVDPFDGISFADRVTPTFVDLDGDGRLDLVTGDLRQGAFRALRDTGAGTPRFEDFAPDPFVGIRVGVASAPAFLDLDGDGRLDLVSGSSSGLVFAFRDTGASSGPRFEAFAVNPFQGNETDELSSPTFLDLDGDGRLDLVVGEGRGRVFASRNIDTGTGSRFERLDANPFEGIDVGTNSAPAFLDLDGDGRLDLVLGAEDGTLRAFRDTGATSGVRFQPFAVNPFASIDVGLRSKPAVVDLDGDGRLDLVVGNTAGQLLALRTTGAVIDVIVTAENDAPAITSAATARFAENGTGIAYQATAADPDGPAAFTWSLSGADAALFTIDADGAVRFALAPDFEQPQDRGEDNVHDIVVAVSDGTATTTQAVAITVTNVPEVPRLGGVGAFAAFAESQVNAAPRLLAPAATFTQGDTLADATLTVAGLLAEDRVTILSQGNAPGQIGFDGTVIRFGGTEIGTASGGDGAPFVVTLTDAADGPAVQALLGRLAYANASETPTLFRTLTLDLVQANGGAPGGPAAPAFALLADEANPFAGIGAGGNAAPTLGDIDGDGLPDLVVGNGSGVLSAWRNTGAGFEPFVTNPFGLINGGNLSKPALGDIDGDGLLDLAVGNVNGTVSAWRNTGSGFEDFPTNPFAKIDVGTRSTPAFGDIDADGLPDLVVGEDFGALAAWRNTGLDFEPFVTNPFAGITTLDYVAPALGDINRDGRPDLVLGEDNGRLELWLNSGSGFVRAVDNPFVVLDVASSTPALGDFDGDGRLDLVSGNDFGTLASWRNVTPPAASLTVAVTAENDAPRGPRVVTLASSAEDAPRVITQAQLLAGWSDPEGAALQALDLAVISDPAGTLVDNGDGTWSFTPSLNDNSNVVFAFDVSDGANQLGAVARMDLTPVNDAPTGIVNLLINASAGVLTTSAALVDVDGMGELAFRWQAFTEGAWQDIPGAIGFGFAPSGALLGTLIRSVARYTDGDGTVEEVASAFVARIGGAGNDAFASPGRPSLQSGGAGADTITGVNQRDLLFGGTGNDSIVASNGNDILLGEAGADTLTGGAGFDIFRYVRLQDGGDLITDFTPGADTIQVDATFFKGLPLGALAPAHFALGGPGAAIAQILYAAGVVSFDPDGTGPAAAVMMAALGGAPALTASDIFVIP